MAKVPILVNRSPINNFVMEKGVRKEDSLFMYLFIMAIEGLITALKEVGILRGVELPNNGPNILSLHYANDALLMGE